MKALVREFQPEDGAEAWRLARVIYPELYAQVDEMPPMEGFDKGWVVEVEGKIVGFAFCLGQYVSDVAVLVDEEKKKRSNSVALLWAVLRHIRQVGGVWSATCRHSTSYALLKSLEEKKRLRIIREEPQEPIGGEPRSNVWFEMLER